MVFLARLVKKDGTFVSLPGSFTRQIDPVMEKAVNKLNTIIGTPLVFPLSK